MVMIMVMVMVTIMLKDSDGDSGVTVVINQTIITNLGLRAMLVNYHLISSVPI